MKAIKLTLVFFLCLFLSGCNYVKESYYKLGGQEKIVENINVISTEIMKANIKVFVYFANEDGIIVSSKQGSGFIYEKEGKDYQAISNAHVFTDEGNRIKKIEIYDYLMNDTYVGSLEKIDETNDMALVQFSSNNEYSLHAITFADKLPSMHDVVYAVGNPLGQPNVITAGKYFGVTEDIVDSVFTFGLICSSVPLDHGNSGGMLLDSELKVIGMNTLELEGSDEITAGSIPYNEIITFINE